MAQVHKLVVDGKEVATVTQVDLQKLASGERVCIHIDASLGAVFLQQLDDGRWRMQTDKVWFFEDSLDAFVVSRELRVRQMFSGLASEQALREGACDVVVSPTGVYRGYPAVHVKFHYRLADVMKPLLSSIEEVRNLPASRFVASFGVVRRWLHIGHTPSQVALHLDGLDFDLQAAIHAAEIEGMSQEMFGEG